MRSGTKSFVAEFGLHVDAAGQAKLSKALRAHQCLYNGVLAEALQRADAMKRNPDWETARALEKGCQERKDAFEALRERHGFTPFGLQQYAQRMRDACFIKDHAKSHDTQATAQRAYRAVNEFVVGLRGRPRFRSMRRFRSFEGKNNEAVLRLREIGGVWCVLGLGLTLALRIRQHKTDTWQQDALAAQCKYVRLLRREIRGKPVWVAQLVMKGLPPTKARHPCREGIVGLDLGPRTIAAVGDAQLAEPGAFKQLLSPTSEGPRKRKRRLSRAMDRSRRATNPQEFDERGRVKPGKHKWHRSQNYRTLTAKLREAERVRTAARKVDHGSLCNRLLSMGNIIKLEKLNYVAWQKCFGRSVSNHAPGGFVATLARKVENTGGQVVLISPRATRLSQYDHVSATYVKKPLQQRKHVFADGTWVDRDVYSAWLARFVEDDLLGTTQLHRSWAAVGALLKVLAVPRSNNNTTRKRSRRTAPSTLGPKAQSVRTGRQDKAAGRGSRPSKRNTIAPLGEVRNGTARISAP